VEHKLLVFEAEKCSGCGNCLTVCPPNEVINSATTYGQGSILSNILRIENGKMTAENICHHCTDSPCKEACQKEVIEKQALFTILRYDLTDENIEQYQGLLDICKDCEDYPCIKACPYEHIVLVPIYVRTERYTVPIKCDQCKGDPACVKVCPTGALRYISVEEKFSDKYKLAATLARSAGLAASSK
jgi:Fe-S-cluster-containing hydrogenase component 2